MNEHKVNELLQRYFNGATSLDEERDLQRYFTGSDIPESLKVYRPLFNFFAEERAIEPVTCHSSLVTNEQRNRLLPLYIITTIAASIAILFMVSVPKIQTDEYVYYVNGQRVYNQTAAIAMAENKLQMLAVSMQKANTGMATFDKLQETNQSLQQFSKISDVYKRIELRIEN